MRTRNYLLMILILSVSKAFSFDLPNVGFIAGPSYGKFYFTENDPGSILILDYKTGYQFGMYYDINMSHKLTLRPEVDYTHRGTILQFKFSGGLGDALGTLRYANIYNYIELIPQVLYSVTERLYFTFGVAAGAFLFGKAQYPEISDTYVIIDEPWIDIESDIVTFPTVGLISGLKVHLTEKTSIGVRCYYGLTDVRNDIDTSYRATNLQLLLGVSL